MRLQGSPVLVSIAMARRHIDENQNIIEFERVECIFEQHVEGLRPEVDEDVDDEHDVHDEVHHVERRTVATALHRRRLLLHKRRSRREGEKRREEEEDGPERGEESTRGQENRGWVWRTVYIYI